jgi:cytochrome b subunit of formate dehydrogenase
VTNMFRTISIIAFLATFLGIGICCLIFPCCEECRKRPFAIFRRTVRIFTMLFLEQKLSLVGALRKLVYLLALLCFLVLAVTSFYPVIILKEAIHGYWLILHATFAMVFVICLAVLVVMWAGNCRFNRNDWPWLTRIIERVTLVKSGSDEPFDGCPGLGRKITFWLIAALALPLILSIILSMFPFFGTYWQELLLDIHRYTALAFAVVAIVHTYLMIRAKMKE